MVKIVVIQRKEIEKHMQMSTSCHWNNATDGQITHQYFGNPEMMVILTLFATAL